MKRSVIIPFFSTASLLAITATAQGAEPVLRYDDGLHVGRESDVAHIEVGGRAQGRYTSERAGDDPVEDEWAAQRLRLSAKGHVGTPRLTYFTQLAFEEGFELRDAFGDFEIIEGGLSVRVGKWKMPSARHHLNSSGRLALVDRSITHKAFDASRGIGIALHDNVEGKNLFGWSFGGFLDDTNRLRFADRAVGTNIDRPYEPALAGRVAVNFGGAKVNDEIYWEGGPARAGLGAYAVESLDTRGDGDGRLRTGVDWIAQYGPLSVTGDVQAAFQHTGDGTVYDGVGFHQQVAALFFKHLSPAVRFGVVDPVGDALDQEFAVGLTGYVFKHGLSLGSDFSLLRSVGEPDETRVRVQAQVVF